MKIPFRIPGRLAAALVVVVLGGVAYAVASIWSAAPTTQSSGPASRPSGTNPNLPPCDEPKPIASPSWLPKDLPLPPGSYAYQDLEAVNGYHRGLFVAPQELTALTRFILTKWPAAGWSLGRGDAEAGEIETGFSKAPAVGSLRARTVFCTPGYTALLLVYTPNRAAAPGTTPTVGDSGSPLGSIPSPQESDG